MHFTSAEHFFLRLEKRIFDAPKDYLAELVSQVRDNVEEETKNAKREKRTLTIFESAKLVDQLERVAMQVDGYSSKGKITDAERQELYRDIHGIAEVMKTYIPNPKKRPPDDRDGSALLPA